MDKETLSNYGWIVICVLVLAVMIALAGPFGTFVAGAVKSTTQGLFDVNQGALDAAGITIDDNAFAEGNGGAGQNPVAPVAYEIIEGAGQTVTTTDASFRSSADYDKFDSVKVDNSVVDPSNYTVSEGSTIILLDGEYLATLSNGTHILEVVSNDGSASCEFTVNIVSEPVSPVPLAGSATFSDGVTLSWAELQVDENVTAYAPYGHFTIDDTKISDNTFINCTSLTKITIPDGVTKIYAGVFSNCKNLTAVTIPVSTIMVGSYAFNNCTNLTEINYAGTTEQWASIAYTNWNKNSAITKVICSDGTVSLS